MLERRQEKYYVTIKIADRKAPLVDGSNSAFGHMWYSLERSSSLTTQSVGFMPSKDGRPFYQGTVRDSDDEHYLQLAYSRKIEISETQYTTLQNFGANPGTYGFNTFYNGLSNSCIDFVWRGLQMAGLNPSSLEGDILPRSNINEVMSIRDPRISFGMLSTEQFSFWIDFDLFSNQITSLNMFSNDLAFQSDLTALDFGLSLKDGLLFDESIPQLNPNAPIYFTDLTGTKIRFDFVDGDPDLTLQEMLDRRGTLSTIGVTKTTTRNGQTIGVIGSQALVSINDPTLGPLTLSGQTFFQMLGERVKSYSNFAESIVKDVTSRVDGATFPGATEIMKTIMIEVLKGRDIEEVAKEIAVSTVAAGAVDALVKQLKGEEVDIFKILENLKKDSTLSIDVIKDSITAVAVTAILNGRDAGLEDYVKVAATASVKRVIERGVDSYYVKNGISSTNKNGVVIRAPENAAAVAALVDIASSVISGKGITEDTLRSAAVSGTIAYASTAIAQLLLSGVAGGPVGMVAMVVSYVLKTAISNMFRPGGERVYHHETIGSIKQAKPDGTGDMIIGVREAGALLMAGSGADDLIGTVGDDVLVGNDKYNILSGNAGDDMLEGRANDDALLGGDGHDHIEAGDGDDYVEGNDGNDKLFGDEGNDNILAGAGDDMVFGGAGDDKIEGEAGDDFISGDSGNDVILAGPGNDVVEGRDGDDVIDAGPGDDQVEGNIGNDEIHGGDGQDRLMGGPGNDLINGDAGNDLIYGDEGIDMLYGELGDDILDGGDGADLLFGGMGKDVLAGGDGDDHLYGELDDDYLVGEKGDDLLSGGDGNDVYVFGRGDGHDSVDDSAGSKDIVRLANYVEQEIALVVDGNDLVLRAPNGIDSVRLINQLTDKPIELLIFADGRAMNMTSLVFNTQGAPSYTFSSEDTTALITQTTFPGTWRSASQAANFLNYNPASSWYQQNFDTSVISSATEMQLYNDVQIRATVVKRRSWYGRTRVIINYNDYYQTRLVGTEGSDRIVGAFWAETINGLGGNDQLYGNSGDDTIDGGTEHDYLLGGSQADVIQGGDGHDKVYGGMGDDTINGGAGNDALMGDDGNDSVHGDDGDDIVSGNGGDDTLYGDAGHDELYGDAGIDRLYGGDGHDFIVGGEGNDIADGGTGDDFIEGDVGNDQLSGGDGDDTLLGGDGDDSLSGGTGKDLLVGGKGADVLDGGGDVDTVSYLESDAGVTINLATGAASGGHATGDSLTQIENVIGTDYNDQLTGDSQANYLEGGYGNDVLIGADGDDVLLGGAGKDTLDGGSGWDTVSYADSASGVDINLATGTGRYGHAEGDTLTNIEHVIGSPYDDTFIVGNSTSTFEAGAGYDSIVLPGPASDYEIILNRNVLTAKHRVTNQFYSFPDGERLTFDDKSYGLEDFPGDGDAVALMLENDRANGVILQNPANKTVTFESNGAHGTAVINSDGSYSYAPQTDFLGEDSFALRVVDTQTRLIRIQNVDVQVNVNGTSAQKVIRNADYERDIKWLQDGSHVMVWVKTTWTPTVPYGSDGVFNYQIHMQHYNKNFVPINSEILLTETNRIYSNNGQTVTGEGLAFPKIAALSNGYISLVWAQTISNGNLAILKQQILSKNGNSVSAIQYLSPLTNNVYYLEIIPLKNSGFAVAFGTALPSMNSDIVLQKFDLVGNKLSETMITTSSLDDRTPKLSEFINGDLLITWLTNYGNGAKTDINAQIVHASGNPSPVMNICPPQWSARGENDLYNYYYDVTVLNQDLFAVVFVSSPATNYKTLVQVFNTAGMIMGNHTFLAPSTAYIGTNTHNIRIITVGEAQFLVVWPQILEPSMDEELQAQLFDFNCNIIGEKMIITSPTYARQQRATALFETSKENVEIVFEDQRAGFANLMAKTVNVLSTLHGSVGNDVLQGDTKKNLLHGSKGADVLDGGDNSDTVSYLDSDAAVQINLAEMPYVDVEGMPYILGRGGHAEGDRVRNIENIIGSRFNDTLSGAKGNNMLDGLEGFDVSIYRKNFSDYFLYEDHDVIIVQDRNISDADDGIDTLAHVEKIIFADTEVLMEEFPNGENSFARVLQNGTAVGALYNKTLFQFRINSFAQYGNVSLNGETYFYVPDPGFLGSDQFSYFMTNQRGLSKIIYVDVEVANNIMIAATTRASFRVNEATDGNQWDPIVIKSFNHTLINTWGKSGSSNTGAFARIFGLDGNVFSHDFKIDYLDSDTSGASASCAVAFPDGAFSIFWEDASRFYRDSSSTGIFVQKFDALGQPIGNSTQVNSFILGEQRNPKAVLLSDNNILAIWTSQVTSNEVRIIKGKILNQSNNQIISEFDIDQANSIGMHPQVIPLKNGGFVVALEKIGPTGYDIFIRQMNNQAVGLDSKKINSRDMGDQRIPALIETEEGGFIVAWFDFQQQQGDGADNTNVMLRKFDVNGDPIGPEIIINKAPFSMINRNWSAETFATLQIVDLGNNCYLISWTSKSKLIKARVIDTTTFMPMTDEIDIVTDFDTINLHSVVQIAEGKVALSWKETDVVSGNIYTEIIDVNYPHLTGTPGNDVLQSGDGNDVIEGKEGVNVYQTGAGKDTVIISVNPNAQEIITDFDLVNDVLDLTTYNFLINGFSDLKRHLIQEGADTVIDFGNGHQVVLQNITMTNLLATHFIGTSGANSLPVAKLWQATTEPGVSVSIDVLSQASDLDGDMLIISSVTQPANGTVTIVNGTIHYVPSAGFHGIEQLSYVVSDGHGGDTIKQLSIVIKPEVIVPPQMNITIQPPASNVASSTSSNSGSLFNSHEPSMPSVNSAPAPYVNPISVSSVNPTTMSSINPILGASTIPMPLPEASELNPASPPAPPVPSSANRLSNPFASLFTLPAAIFDSGEKIDSPSSTSEDARASDETLPDYHSTVTEQLMLFRLVGHCMKGWMPWNKVRELTSYEIATLKEQQEKLIIFYEKSNGFNNSIIQECGLFDDKLRWLDKSIRESCSKINSILKKTETTSSQWDELTNKLIKIEKMLDSLTSKQQQLELSEVESARLAQQGQRCAIGYDAINDILTIDIEAIEEETTTCANSWETSMKTPFGLQQQFWRTAQVQLLTIENEPTSLSVKMLGK